MIFIKCNCNNCPQKGRKKLNNITPTKKDIMVIGDIPTPFEVNKGVCMTGKAVDILKQAMKKVGLPIYKNKVYYTTALKCCLPKKGQVSIQVQKACHKNLIEEIKQVKPKLILCLGKTALQTLLKKAVKITEYEGRILSIKQLNTKVLPIKHPGVLIKAPGEYKNFYAALTLAKKVYDGQDLKSPKEVKWTIISNKDKWNAFKKQLNENKWKYGAADIETTGLDYRTAEFCVLGISFDGNFTYVIPREMKYICKEFFNICRKNNIKIIWHHGKYDSKVMWRRNLGNIPYNEDTLYLHYVLNEDPPHDLGFLTKVFLQAPEYKYKMNQQFKAVTLKTYSKFFNALCERVAVDCAYTYQLFFLLKEKIDKNKTLKKVYSKLLMPAAEMLNNVEQNGMLINPNILLTMDTKYKNLLITIKKEINNIAKLYWDPDAYKQQMGAKTAPKIFNPGSPKQVSWLILKRLKLKPRICRKDSVSAEILKSIDPIHPLVEKILEYRSIKKEHSTYVKGLLNARDTDGRIRSTFSLHVTATGRLSSKKPNVQNIPSAFGVGNIRKAFIPKQGYMLMEVDYSGAELRWLACLSSDKTLSKIFKEGRNLHDETAAALFGKDFTKQDRMRAKAVNFGIPYGREANSLAEEFSISTNEAQEMINNWLNAYPQAKNFLNSCANKVIEGKYLETPYGRQRRFGLITPMTLHDLQNEAKNMPIQSSSSDTLLYACILIEKELKEKYNTKIINLIHDSMLLEVPEDPNIIQKVSQYTSKVMCELPKKLFNFEVPFTSDTDLGYSWGDFVAYNNKKHTVEINNQNIPFNEWQRKEKEKIQNIYNQDWYKKLQSID